MPYEWSFYLFRPFVCVCLCECECECAKARLSPAYLFVDIDPVLWAYVCVLCVIYSSVNGVMLALWFKKFTFKALTSEQRFRHTWRECLPLSTSKQLITLWITSVSCKPLLFRNESISEQFVCLLIHTHIAKCAHYMLCPKQLHR